MNRALLLGFLSLPLAACGNRDYSQFESQFGVVDSDMQRFPYAIGGLDSKWPCYSKPGGRRSSERRRRRMAATTAIRRRFVIKEEIENALNVGGLTGSDGRPYSISTTISIERGAGEADVLIALIDVSEYGRDEPVAGGLARVGWGSKKVEMGPSWPWSPRVAPHEFLHVLGLRHRANETKSILSYYGSSRPGHSFDKRLNEDDVASLVSL